MDGQNPTVNQRVGVEWELESPSPPLPGPEITFWTNFFHRFAAVQNDTSEPNGIVGYRVLASELYRDLANKPPGVPSVGGAHFEIAYDPLGSPGAGRHATRFRL